MARASLSFRRPLGRLISRPCSGWLSWYQQLEHILGRRSLGTEIACLAYEWYARHRRRPLFRPTLERSCGTTHPVCTMKFCMPSRSGPREAGRIP